MKRFSGWALAWVGFGSLLYVIWYLTKNTQPWGLVLAAGVVTTVIMMQGLRVVDRNPRKTKLTK